MELFIDVLRMFYASKFTHDLHLPPPRLLYPPIFTVVGSRPCQWGQLNLMNLKTKTETQRGKTCRISVSVSKHMLGKSIELWVGQGQGQGGDSERDRGVRWVMVR